MAELLLLYKLLFPIFSINYTIVWKDWDMMKKGQLEIDEQQNKMQVLLSILPFKEYKFLVQILPIIFTVFSILKEQVLALKLEILGGRLL